MLNIIGSCTNAGRPKRTYPKLFIYLFVQEPAVAAKRLVKKAGVMMKGLVASKEIKEGTTILTDWTCVTEGFKILTLSEWDKLEEPQKSLFIAYAINVDFDHLLGPVEEEALVFDSLYVNHSCDPNMWFGPGDVVCARSDISEGEELTMDYSMFYCAFDETFQCECGSSDCRRLVRKNDWKIEDIRRKYKNHFSEFLNHAIENSNVNGIL